MSDWDKIKEKLKEAENKLNEANKKFNDKLNEANDEFNKIIKKANDEANDIINNAKSEANNIINNAKSESNNIINNAKNEANNIINNAENIAKEKVKSTVQELAKNISEEAAKYIEDIKKDSGLSQLEELANNVIEELKNLKEMLDIKKVIETAINKGEEAGEGYLKTKLTPIEDLGFTVEPDLEINFENNRNLKIDLFIYCIYKELGQVYDKSKSHLILSLNLGYDILQPLNIKKTLESIRFDIKFNEDSIKQAVEEKIQSEQEKLLEAFLIEFFSEYINIFDGVKKLLSL